MITAYNIQRAIPRAIVEAKSAVREIAPNATFVLVGANNFSIYFYVVARLGDVTERQARDLEKTRFELTAEMQNDSVFKAEFKVSMYPGSEEEV